MSGGRAFYSLVILGSEAVLILFMVGMQLIVVRSWVLVRLGEAVTYSGILTVDRLLVAL